MAQGDRDGTREGGGGVRRRRPPPAAGPSPDEASLHEAALNHLARFATTEAGLRRVLMRRVDRWARRAKAEVGEAALPERIAERVRAGRAAAAAVAKRMVAAGAVDDAAYAAARAKRLNRAGRSRRAIAAHLSGKGVDAETARAALPEAEADEIAAALALCRRRRIGPFARTPEDADARRRSLGALARAGFTRDVAEAALAMDPETAEARLIEHRRD